MSSVEIRELTSVDELQAAADLEREIWGTEPVPVHQTLTSVHNGGISLGAYEGSKLIGFLYSFPGFHRGNAYLCSHTMGIHPAAQKQKIGESLKMKQRELAAQKGYSSIVWTFDPLLSLNAYLNLHKLGAVAVRYIENHYGAMTGSLNAGLPSDRFQVQWSVNNGHVVRPEVTEFGAALLETGLREDGLPVVTSVPEVVLSDRSFWLVPIPADFFHVKAADMSLAIDWRMQTRRAFLKLMDAGFVGVDLVRTPHHISYYVFTQTKQKRSGAR